MAATTTNVSDDLEVHTLDVYLFSTRHYWFGRLVEWFTSSPYSHVGLGLRRPTYINAALTGTYLFESGLETRNGKSKLGVQITDMSWMVPNYDGGVWRRRFQWLDDKPHRTRSVLDECYSQTQNAPYDANLLDLLRAELGRPLGNGCQRTDEFFCSALVGYVLAKLGVLPPDTEWDLLRPCDFAVGGAVDQLMAKVGVARLGPLERVK